LFLCVFQYSKTSILLNRIIKNRKFNGEKITGRRDFFVKRSAVVAAGYSVFFQDNCHGWGTNFFIPPMDSIDQKAVMEVGRAWVSGLWSMKENLGFLAIC